jgi:hypothetical protein
LARGFNLLKAQSSLRLPLSLLLQKQKATASGNPDAVASFLAANF